MNHAAFHRGASGRFYVALVPCAVFSFFPFLFFTVPFHLDHFITLKGSEGFRFFYFVLFVVHTSLHRWSQAGHGAL